MLLNSTVHLQVIMRFPLGYWKNLVKNFDDTFLVTIVGDWLTKLSVKTVKPVLRGHIWDKEKNVFLRQVAS